MGKFNPNETDIPTIIPVTISVFVSFLYILLHTYAAIATVRRTSDDISKNGMKKHYSNYCYYKNSINEGVWRIFIYNFGNFNFILKTLSVFSA